MTRSVFEHPLFSPYVITGILFENLKTGRLTFPDHLSHEIFLEVLLMFVDTGVATTLFTTVHSYLRMSFWLEFFKCICVLNNYF